MGASSIGGSGSIGSRRGRPLLSASKRPKPNDKIVIFTLLCLISISLSITNSRGETTSQLESIKQAFVSMTSMFLSRGANDSIIINPNFKTQRGSGKSSLSSKTSNSNNKSTHSPASNLRLGSYQGETRSQIKTGSNAERARTSLSEMKSRAGGKENLNITILPTQNSSREPKMITPTTAIEFIKNQSGDESAASISSSANTTTTTTIPSDKMIIMMMSSQLVDNSSTSGLVESMKSDASPEPLERQQSSLGQTANEWPTVATSQMTKLASSSPATMGTTSSQQVVAPPTLSPSFYSSQGVVKTPWRPVTKAPPLEDSSESHSNLDSTSSLISTQGRVSTTGMQFPFDSTEQQHYLQQRPDTSTGSYSYESPARTSHSSSPARQEILLAEKVAAKLRRRLYHAPDETGRLSSLENRIDRIEQQQQPPVVLGKSALQSPKFATKSATNSNSTSPKIGKPVKNGNNSHPCRFGFDPHVAHDSSECLEVTQSCSEEGMEFSLQTQEPFSGRIYTYGYYDSCYTDADANTTNVLRITRLAKGFPRCGTQQFGDMITNIVVVQFSDYVQTARDRKYNLTCHFSGDGEAVVTSSYLETRIDERSHPVQIEHLPAQNIVTSNVRLRILYRGQPTNTIALGDLLTLRLEKTPFLSSPFRSFEPLTPLMSARYQESNRLPMGNPKSTHSEIFATNVLAKDPYSGRQVQLIDGRGCPVDAINVFPELQRTADGSLESEFYAFKIPDSNYLIFQATIRNCKSPCEPVFCHSTTSGFNSQSLDSNSSVNFVAGDVKGGYAMSNLISNKRPNSTPSWGRRRRRRRDTDAKQMDLDGAHHDGKVEGQRIREMFRVFGSREELNERMKRATAIGGIDLRSQSSLAPLTLHKIGYAPPVCLHQASYYGLLFACISLSLFTLSLMILGFTLRHKFKWDKWRQKFRFSRG